MKVLFWIAVTVLIVFLVWYAARGRDWLKSQSWTAPFYTHPWVEWIEIKFWKKSQTILWARAKMFGGVLLTALTQLGTIDLSPLLPLIPDKYEPLARVAINLIPMFLTVIGMIDERNRNETRTPIDIVALPDKVIAESPKLAEAVAMLDVAKVEAVAVAKEVEAENVATEAAAPGPPRESA